MLMPVHPGRILKRELQARALSANGLALALRVPSGRITGILNGQRAVTPDTALRLGRHFGNSPRFWANLQTAAVVAVTLALSSCVYTVERQWIYTSNLSKPLQSFQVQRAEAEAANARFPETLRGCIAKNDAAALNDYDKTHEYRISGWFLNNDRTGPVIRCMRDDGWVAMPTTLLAP